MTYCLSLSSNVTIHLFSLFFEPGLNFAFWLVPLCFFLFFMLHMWVSAPQLPTTLEVRHLSVFDWKPFGSRNENVNVKWDCILVEATSTKMHCKRTEVHQVILDSLLSKSNWNKWLLPTEYYLNRVQKVLFRSKIYFKYRFIDLSYCKYSSI